VHFSACLQDSYVENDERVALSIIATETFVPSAQAQRTEQCVKTYVKCVHDLAKYVAGVDLQRTTFVYT
jgi:hypothetical protein